MYFIGRNKFGEFGLGYEEAATGSLVKCPNKLLTKVFCGYCYNIFTDNNLDEIWCAGTNYEGECGIDDDATIDSYTEITHFKSNNIKIKNIFTNASGFTTFFISTQEKLMIAVKELVKF